MSSSSAAETRSHSAMFKRAKQLEHWNESDTHKASTEPRTSKQRARVQGRRQIQGNIFSNLDFKRRFVHSGIYVHTDPQSSSIDKFTFPSHVPWIQLSCYLLYM